MQNGFNRRLLVNLERYLASSGGKSDQNERSASHIAVLHDTQERLDGFSERMHSLENRLSSDHTRRNIASMPASDIPCTPRVERDLNVDQARGTEMLVGLIVGNLQYLCSMLRPVS